MTGRLAAAWRFVRRAPLTYLWLTVLLITTIIQRTASRRYLHFLLVHDSTNIRHLATDPLDALFSSLLWIDGRYWTPYLLLFTLFLAPAEQWLGQIRWLTVGLTAHVAATYISEGLLYLEIQYHQAPERLVHARDIGVSYFMVGVIAVLAYRIATPWRWGYLAILIAVFGVPLIIDANFTAIGHFSAIFIGLLCYPVARARGGPPVNPGMLLAAVRSA
ncbi:MAG TPA: rhomboid-like protein [Mycobacterium sp.]|uniref:rhomboid-like protein n=1 Tax=Mycobacterium sp. TaxID=1785 RepID=UPI002CB33223|nr:rhomboid-like protein [Mycobacterium sp.]HME75055.1 rhomboid-like protein [Mycobacterium sp.]